MGQMLKKVLTHSVVVTFSDQERLATLCAMAKGALPTNFIGILDRLLEKGASFTKSDSKGITPLSLACKSGNIDAVSLFIARHGDVNAYPSLLTDAVEGENGPIVELLLMRMTPKSVLFAQKEAFRRGITHAFQKEVDKYAKIISHEKQQHEKITREYPELMTFEAIRPPLKVQVMDYLRQFHPFSAQKRADARTLVVLKRAYQRHERIHYEDALIDAVMRRLPQTFDFVEHVGAPFLVQEKAFQKIKDDPKEDVFLANWLDVTDSVCVLRRHRREVFCRRHRFFKNISRRLRSFSRKPVNYWEEAILLNRTARKNPPVFSKKIVLKPKNTPTVERQTEVEKSSSSVLAHFKDGAER